MALFKVLANDTRLRLLHHLVRAGEARSPTSPGRWACSRRPSPTSSSGCPTPACSSLRRDGNNVYYRVVNGCVAPLLDLALCLMEDEGGPPRRTGQEEPMMPRRSRTPCGRSTGRSRRAACPATTPASAPSPRRSATRPRNWPAIPAEANMGLSCGNPTATANLRPGEVVVDLGCGGGLDVFLAAQKVGPTGKAIGIDMTPEMIELAQEERRASRGSPTSSSTWRPSTTCRCPTPRPTGDLQLRHQPRPGQAGRLPRDRPRPEARRAAGRLRHRAEEAAAAGARRRPDGLRRLHRRGHPDRRLRRGAARPPGSRRVAGHRHAGRT